MPRTSNSLDSIQWETDSLGRPQDFDFKTCAAKSDALKTHKTFTQRTANCGERDAPDSARAREALRKGDVRINRSGVPREAVALAKLLRDTAADVLFAPYTLLNKDDGQKAQAKYLCKE